MSFWTSRYWYVPVLLVIVAGYATGAWMYISVYECTQRPSRSSLPSLDELRRLFGLGLIGGAMYSHYFFSRDANAKIYGDTRLPTFLDPAGYALLIASAGLTGIILYVAIKAGLLVVLTGDAKEVHVNGAVRDLVALGGGLMSQNVRAFLASFVGTVLNHNSVPPPAKASQGAGGNAGSSDRNAPPANHSEQVKDVDHQDSEQEGVAERGAGSR